MLKVMTKSIDALEARTHFGEVMERTEKEKTRFLVSRRGKPKVVILSIEDYMKNIIKQSELLTQVQMSAEKSGLNLLSDKEIDVEIEAYRKSKK